MVSGWMADEGGRRSGVRKKSYEIKTLKRVGVGVVGAGCWRV